MFVLPTQTHTSFFRTKKGPLTVRITNRKNDWQTHFRTLFFAPEQQHTIYVQSSFIILLFSNCRIRRPPAREACCHHPVGEGAAEAFRHRCRCPLCKRTNKCRGTKNTFQKHQRWIGYKIQSYTNSEEKNITARQPVVIIMSCEKVRFLGGLHLKNDPLKNKFSGTQILCAEWVRFVISQLMWRLLPSSMGMFPLPGSGGGGAPWPGTA